MLAFIGIGLGKEKDISVQGLELIKASDVIYLETYTSKLQCTKEDLENFYGKNIQNANREFVEDGKTILKEASEKNVALLIIGDVFSATTHIALYMEAKNKNIPVKVIHNASIVTAVGITGLEIYKFGKITSIPFHESSTPFAVIQSNKPLHTLCLLDLVPDEEKYMEAAEAIERLAKHGFSTETMVVVCAQLGSDNPTIIYTQAKNVKPLKKFPQCLIVPGDLHFIEKESLEMYSAR